MTGLPGNIAIVSALVLAVISGLSFLLTSLGKKNLYELGKRAYYLQIGLISFGMLYLWNLFFNNDYSIKYVYEYSSSNLPFFYKFSGLWAGQDGTYLLWLFLSLWLGLVLFKRVKQFSSLSLFVHTLVNLFLYVMLLTLSPFRQLNFVPPEGAGLNPLLQDPWMVIHPPIVFVGFAMAGIVFSIVMAVLLKRDFKNWVTISFPYVAFTALALAIANVLGGYWAYKTLGWGGYWAWDPVENTSFIPWILALGAFHGMLIEKRIGALRRVNLILSSTMFLMAVYGTFLTRSGVLADFSVHSFVDLGINAVLISFVLFYFIFSLMVFIYGFMKNAAGQPMNYNIYSREFILMAGQILLVALALIVLFWSSLPFLTTYLTDSPAAAEIRTYNTFAFPLAILMSLLLTISPFFGKKDHEPKNKKLIFPISIIIGLVAAGALFLLGLIDITIAVTLFVYLFVAVLYAMAGTNTIKLFISFIIGLVGILIAALLGVKDISYLFFIGAATAGATAHVIMLVKMIPGNLKNAGGSLSHLGYGFMLLGILASSAFSTNDVIILPRNEMTMHNGIGFDYQGMSGPIDKRNNEVILTLVENGNEIEARPHYFYTRRMDAIMKRPFIEKGLFYDLYLSPQEVQEIPHSQGLILGKGETRQVGDYNITFTGFEMAPHSMEGGSSVMSVGVALEVDKDGRKEKVVPRLSNAGNGMQAEAVPLFSDSAYVVKVERIDADNGLASFSIPGLVEAGPPDRLILDVSYKPGINLLWLGTLIVFFGLGLSVYRRMDY